MTQKCRFGYFFYIFLSFFILLITQIRIVYCGQVSMETVKWQMHTAQYTKVTVPVTVFMALSSGLWYFSV